MVRPLTLIQTRTYMCVSHAGPYYQAARGSPTPHCHPFPLGAEISGSGTSFGWLQDVLSCAWRSYNMSTFQIIRPKSQCGAGDAQAAGSMEKQFANFWLFSKPLDND